VRKWREFEVRLGAVISLFGSVAAAWPVAAQMQPTQPTKATTANLPKIEIVRVKRIDPDGRLGFNLRGGIVDLTKGFSLGGSEGIGATWKMPLTGETFDARYGRW
jgi:hypothetical protein